jgi:predicted O-methyltransferase YrrM
MSHQQAVLQGFQQLNAQLVQEELQKPPVAPDQGPQQNPQQQLNRLAFGFGFYLKPRLSELIHWAQRSRETSNFTYDLTDLNLGQLAGWVSLIAGCSLQQASQYIHEIRHDEALRHHLNQLTASSDSAITADLNMGYGRRLGWYALVRALKPRTVVETGVDKGLGSCVLAAALLRNRAEGHPGRYFGTDINPQAGWLFQGAYREVGEILYGDSIESLQRFEGPIDLFINDSDHSAEYEEREYACIAPKLSPAAVVLGDNAHVTDKLYQFAVATGRRFLFFSEKPADHWYPGAGIGAAWGQEQATSDAAATVVF